MRSLKLFADANGRTWKSKLRDLWMNGQYWDAELGGADSSHLQQIRNQFGPRWLVRFRFSLNNVTGAELTARDLWLKRRGLMESAANYGFAHNVMVKVETVENGGIDLWTRRTLDDKWWHHGLFGTDSSEANARCEIAESFELMEREQSL